MATRTERLRDMETDHLQCRLWGHAWDHTLTVMSRVGRKLAYELHLTCLRCGGERRDTVYQGVAEKRSYSYADGYLIEGGQKAWGGRSTFHANANDTLLARLVTRKKGVK